MEDTKTEDITVQEAIENAGYSDITEVMRDSLFGASFGVPAKCEHGCLVEPDGTCQHGNQSVLMLNGLI